LCVAAGFAAGVGVLGDVGEGLEGAGGFEVAVAPGFASVGGGEDSAAPGFRGVGAAGCVEEGLAVELVAPPL